MKWLYGHFTSSWHIQLLALHKERWHQCLDEKVVSVQVISAYERVEVMLHSFLAMALLGVVGQLRAWATLSPVPTERGLEGTQVICMLWRKDKSLAPAWDHPKIPEIPTSKQYLGVILSVWTFYVTVNLCSCAGTVTACLGVYLWKCGPIVICFTLKRPVVESCKARYILSTE